MKWIVDGATQPKSFKNTGTVCIPYTQHKEHLASQVCFHSVNLHHTHSSHYCRGAPSVWSFHFNGAWNTDRSINYWLKNPHAGAPAAHLAQHTYHVLKLSFYLCSLSLSAAWTLYCFISPLSLPPFVFLLSCLYLIKVKARKIISDFQ